MTITALAFDYGLKNIGVAYGQSITGTTQAISPLKAKDGIPDWEQIKQLIDQWRPNRLVVGLPLNMDDSDNEITTRARKFAKRLFGRFGVKTELMDERLSSFDAKQIAFSQGHKGDFGKKPIDSLAAQLILESWFNTLNEP